MKNRLGLTIHESYFTCNEVGLVEPLSLPMSQFAGGKRSIALQAAVHHSMAADSGLVPPTVNDHSRAIPPSQPAEKG